MISIIAGINPSGALKAYETKQMLTFIFGIQVNILRGNEYIHIVHHFQYRKYHSESLIVVPWNT